MTIALRHRTTPAAACALMGALTAALAALALVAAPAHANSEQIVKDCFDQGYVNPDRYSRSELQGALDELPADIAEYSDCYDVISEALDAKRKRGRGGGRSDAGGAGAAGVAIGAGGEGASGATDSVDDRGRAHNEIETTLKQGAPKVAVGGAAGAPKLSGVEPAAARNELPLPILLALIAVALTLATGGLLALRGKLRGSLRRRRS